MAKHKEIIISNAVQRDKAFLYYVDGEGNVCRSPRMKRIKGGEYN